MAGMAELTLAVAFAEELQSSGSCTHAGYAYQPMTIATFEAKEIEKFDPDLFEILKANGVSVERTLVSDLDYIGSKIDDITAIAGYSTNSGSKRLHKHAISHRLGKTLVAARTCSDHDAIRLCARIFRHPLNSY